MDSFQCSICLRTFTRKNNHDAHFQKCERENQERLSSQNQTYSASTAQIGGSSAFSPPRTPTVASSSSPQKVLPGASLESSPQTHHNLMVRTEDIPHKNVYRDQGAPPRGFEKAQARTPIPYTLDGPTIPVMSYADRHRLSVPSTLIDPSATPGIGLRGLEAQASMQTRIPIDEVAPRVRVPPERIPFQIVDSGMLYGHLRYLVRWCEEQQPTWQTKAELLKRGDYQWLIDNYDRR